MVIVFIFTSEQTKAFTTLHTKRKASNRHFVWSARAKVVSFERHAGVLYSGMVMCVIWCVVLV